jgi:hypothetical protein
MVSNNLTQLERMRRGVEGNTPFQTAEMDQGSLGETILPNMRVPAQLKRVKGKRTKSAAALPPSVQSVCKSITEGSPDMVCDPPVYISAPSIGIGVVSEVWQTAIKCISAETMNEAAPAHKMSIVLSPCDHDDLQLAYNRRGAGGVRLPLCTSGAGCHAMLVARVPGPLNPYMTPAQQHEFDTHGTSCDGPCLLCIRYICTEMAINLGSNTIGIATTLPAVVPCYNTRDVAGGYKGEYMLISNASQFMQHNIVEFDAGLLKFNPATHRIDQSRMHFGQPLN